MAKVTITIDDTSTAIQSAFGTDAILKVATFYGWQAEVPKTPEELPEKVEVQPTADDIKMGMTEPYMAYPEGTELNKPNPQTAAVFLADLILRRHIAPALTKGYEVARKQELALKAEADTKIAQGAVINAAEVNIVE